MKNGYSKLNHEPNKKETNAKIIKGEKYKKDNIIKSRLNSFIKHLVFFNIISDIFTNDINKRNMNFLNAYEITLKISEDASGSIRILGRNFGCPVEIYINDNIARLDDCEEINVDQHSPIDKVKLVWKNAPRLCSNMFVNCQYITEIDLTNFNTSLVTDMCGMFENCHSLTSVNLSNLDTRKVNTIWRMFFGCSSLTSIDLSNFNTSKISDMDELFSGCTKLQYINLNNFEEKKFVDIENMFNEIPEKAVICVKQERAPKIFNLSKNYNISCDFLNETETPINCNLNGYKYEYKGNCYNICLENTIPYNNKCKSNTDLCNNDCINKVCIYVIRQCKPQETFISEISDICIACNENYYQIKNDTEYIQDLINNYNFTIQGYYLDEKENYYRSCYETCKMCDKSGDEKKHNCSQCNEEYPFNYIKGEYYNCYPKCDFYFYFDNKGGFHCLDYFVCPENYDKLIEEKRECIDDCSKDDKYKYEFGKNCLENIPNDFLITTTTTKHIAIITAETTSDSTITAEKTSDSTITAEKTSDSTITAETTSDSTITAETTSDSTIKTTATTMPTCSKEFPFENINEKNCTNFCGINDISKGLCVIKYKDNSNNDINELILYNILEDIISTNFNKDDLLNNNENIIIDSDNNYINFIISTTDIQKSEIQPLVDLGECKDILKDYYSNLSSENLVLFIIKYDKDNIIKIEYEIYGKINDNKLLKLDLNICNDTINNEIRKCSKYSLESILEDKCISCNIDYYLPLNEKINNNININSFVKCLEIPKEYYYSSDDTYELNINITNYTNIETKIDEDNKKEEDKMVEKIREELITNFNLTKKDVIIQQKNSIITITNTENQKKEKKSNKTTIDFGECEIKIKEAYNISKNESLYILKIDIKQEGYKIPKIEYELYYPLFGSSLIKLDLIACQNTSLEFSIPIVINDNIDIRNSSSAYYNDICYTTKSENCKMITLLDRQKYFIDNNLTICEEDCNFTYYNNSIEKATCLCKVKLNSTSISESKFNPEKLSNKFNSYINYIANFQILSCYKMIFSWVSFTNNYANIILILIILLLFFTIIVFYCKDYHKIFEIINTISFIKIKMGKVNKIIAQKDKKENIKTTINNNNRVFNSINNSIKININKFKKSIRKNKFIKIKNKSTPIKNSRNANSKIKNNTSSLKSKSILNNNASNLNNPSQINFKNLSGEKYKNLSQKQIKNIAIKINKLSETEKNNLSYKEAIKKDKRAFSIYYISLIRTKHILFFSFLPNIDYNSRMLKIFIFFFKFSTDFVVNALFFDDETMHKSCKPNGKYNFIYDLPQIIYSPIITGTICAIIKNMALTDQTIISLKQNKEKDKKQINNKMNSIQINLKIKFIIFFIINLLLLFVFWFYLGCFCAVYKNTQIPLIIDTISSFITSMIYPFGIYLLPAIFRIYALKDKKKEYIYKFSSLLQMI